LGRLIFVARVPTWLYSSIFFSHVVGSSRINTITPMYMLWRVEIGWRNGDANPCVPLENVSESSLGRRLCAWCSDSP
jgi:hypothetical protein